jgi:putative transposase
MAAAAGRDRGIPSGKSTAEQAQPWHPTELPDPSNKLSRAPDASLQSPCLAATDGRLGYFWSMATPNRKRIKHFEQERQVHELTFSCAERRPLLTNDTWRSWFCDGLEAACDRNSFLLLAYVLMPDHVHLLVYPATSEARVAKLLADTKRSFSRRIKRHLTETESSTLQRLTVHEQSGALRFHFWQSGPGYDRNLTEPKAVTAAIAYLHANPVRRGLCRRAIDWPWSSARRLLSDGPLEGSPRLSRFDESLLRIEPASIARRGIGPGCHG